MFIPLLGIALIIMYSIMFVRNRYGYFKCNHVPTPHINYVFGHLKILRSVTSYSRQLQRWTDQFGKVYGIFEGAQPIWVSSDVEFLQEIYIKHFSCFNTRKPEMLTRNTEDSVVHLFDARGSTWKRQRYAFVSLFTPIKLWHMSMKINVDIDHFLATLFQNSSCTEGFNIIPLYQELAFNVSCRQVFGNDNMDMQKMYRIYLSKCKGVSADINQGFLATLDLLFPEFSPLFSRFFLFQNRMRAKLNRWVSRNETTNLFREQPAFWLMGSIRRAVNDEDTINRNPDSVLESFRSISKNHQVSVHLIQHA